MIQDWKQYNGGKRWRVLLDGRIEVQGGGVPTSGGRPLTARYMLLEHGEALHEAHRRYHVPIPWLVGMAAIEALRLDDAPKGGLGWGSSTLIGYLSLALEDRGWRLLLSKGTDSRGASNRFRMDPVSLRMEPGYVGPEDTPGRVSAGLMQTLLTTARSMARQDPWLSPRDQEGNPRPLELGDLLNPRMSILLGACYMSHLRLRDEGMKDMGGADFVQMTGAYNSGSLRPVPLSDNPFGIRTYGPNRTSRGITYYNDCFLEGARELIDPAALK